MKTNICRSRSTWSLVYQSLSCVDCWIIEWWPVISWSVDHHFHGCTALYYVSNGFFNQSCMELCFCFSDLWILVLELQSLGLGLVNIWVLTTNVIIPSLSCCLLTRLASYSSWGSSLLDCAAFLGTFGLSNDWSSAGMPSDVAAETSLSFERPEHCRHGSPCLSHGRRDRL